MYQSRVVSNQSIRYQLRIYAASSDFHKPHINSLLPIEFPLLCDIKVNGRHIKVNTRGVRNQPGTAAPPNADFEKTLNLRPNDLNNIEILYRDTSKKHYIVVNLVEQYSVDYLIKQIENNPEIPKDSVIEKFRNEQDQDDVLTVSFTLNLRCPIGFFRMKTPIRSTQSASIQCFDATSFFSMNEQTPTFTDPIQNKPIKFKDLAVDGYTNSILQCTPDEVESVTVEPDGEWHTDDGKHGSQRWMELNKSSISNHVEKSSSKQSNLDLQEDKKTINKNDEILSLSSDEEDERGGDGNISLKQSAQKSKNKQVIDLTLSSDEEDENSSPLPPAIKVNHSNNNDISGVINTGQKRGHEDDNIVGEKRRREMFENALALNNIGNQDKNQENNNINNGINNENDESNNQGKSLYIFS